MFTDQAVGGVVAEIDVETSEQDNSFDDFISRNAARINTIVSDYQQRYRYDRL